MQAPIYPAGRVTPIGRVQRSVFYAPRFIHHLRRRLRSDMRFGQAGTPRACACATTADGSDRAAAGQRATERELVGVLEIGARPADRWPGA